ncbi:MAG: 30S ribosome-binding factor RbfA [Gammaproteobacteria bacterium]|nr:30S ribosome-binding factor RbfA [Gammaproteobacteria bacterium]MYE83631.1 30S ribosome-binding factor RbfA [Gammaproteobacteria bacterium]
MRSPTRNAERDLRLADFIRDEIARALLSDVRDPRIGMTSVTDVRVNRDMSRADVYVSSLSAGSESEREALVAALDHAAGFLRSMLARRGNLRTTPRLRFHYDDLVESGSRMEALIDRAVEGGAAGDAPSVAAGPRTPAGR